MTFFEKYLTKSFEKNRKDLTLILYSCKLHTMLVTCVKYERQIFSKFHTRVCENLKNRHFFCFCVFVLFFFQALHYEPMVLVRFLRARR